MEMDEDEKNSQASPGAEAALERKRRQTALQDAFRAFRYSPAR